MYYIVLYIYVYTVLYKIWISYSDIRLAWVKYSYGRITHSSSMDVTLK